MLWVELYRTQWYVRKRSETVEGVADEIFQKIIKPTKRTQYGAVEKAFKRKDQIKTALKQYNLVAPDIEDKKAIEELRKELERQETIIARNLK